MNRRANHLLRQARLRLPSPSGSGQPMSRADLAETANHWLYEQTGKTFTMDANQIGKYERGENRWPHRHYRQALCAVLGASRPAELGFYPYRTMSTDPRHLPSFLVPGVDTPAPQPSLGGQPDTDHHESAPLEPFPGEPPPDETMHRRTMLGLSVSALFATAISADTPQNSGLDLVTSLTNHTEPPDTEPVSPHLLATGVAAAKRQYQSCQYQQASDLLPRLLDQVRTACRWLGGTDQLRAHALAADAYQVAGSLLIKRGDVGLAVLAADRSMAAATRSGDPLAVGASARIVTHTLMSAGHLRHATSTAISAAERLDRDGPATPQTLSVAGALLLRGALAAARSADRGTALGLLDEADTLAIRLGQDANERWTAFGPTNVLLHRVSAAVSLGDAGQAVAHAQRVQLDKIILAERRVCLFVDVARALTQWGKPERAIRALLAAEDTAPEEIRTRPAVRRLVNDLIRIAPSSLYPNIRDLADRIGAHR